MAKASRPSRPSPPTAPDAALEAMPGIGLIRVRALRKAGYASVASLLAATADEIATVPGITLVKARQIAEYVAALPAAEPSTPPECGAVLAHAVQQAARAARTLEQTLPPAYLAGRLGRQLGRWIAFAEGVRDGEELPEGERKALARTCRLATRLQEASVETLAGARARDALAGRLRSRRRDLRKLLKAARADAPDRSD
ncbi:MAG: hypothetical protein IT208_16635 [Chthonomonadales bacterium]|nr:hypothetical protein [Chthonomonadales bacterium]